MRLSYYIALSLLLVSAQATAAETLERVEGSFVYDGACASKFAFIYFDGRRVQNLCVEETPEVSIRDFQIEAGIADCTEQVEVRRGTRTNGTLRAQEIVAVHGCIHDVR
jgi:hypothetical protein